MSDQVQLRGGTTVQHATFTGALREITVDTDKRTAVVHDGVTPGGNPLLRQDLSNLPAGALNALVTAPTALVSVNGGPLAGFRNRIINGGMQVAQRIAVTLTNVLQYGQVDRWQGSIVGGTGVTGTLTRGTGIPGFASGSSCLMSGVSFTTGKPYWETRLESLNVQDLNLKTITISGKLFQDTGTTQTFQVGVTNATVVDTFTTQNTLGTSSGISVPSGTLTPFSFTVAINNTSVSYGVAVQVYLTSGITVSNKNFALGDVQLEVGAVATPLEQRFYGIEVALCQRYYEVVIGMASNNISVWSPVYSYAVRKRASATIAGITVNLGTGANIVPSAIDGSIAAFQNSNNTNIAQCQFTAAAEL